MANFVEVFKGTGPRVEHGSKIQIAYRMQNIKSGLQIATNQGDFEEYVLNDSTAWYYHLKGYTEGTTVKYQIGENGSEFKLVYEVAVIL